jgi:glycosyltransferase involved in cell wall biosynthesis
MPTADSSRNRASSLRVLHVVDSLALGGAQSVLATLAGELQRRGIDNRVVALHGPGAALDRFHSRGVSVEWLAASKKDPRIPFRLLRTVWRMRPHIIHTQLVISSLLVELLGGLLPRGTRIVVHLQSQYRPEHRPDKYQNVLERFAYRRADRIVTCGPSVAKGLARQRPASTRAPIVVIPNSVEDAELQGRNREERRRLRAEFGISDSVPVFLSASRLVALKNLDYALRVFAGVRRHVPRAVYLVAGTGPEEKRLHALAAELGLGDSVRFLGFRNDVSALLSAADFCLLPSKYEGLSLFLAEGLGKQAIGVVTPFEGHEALVRHGRTGLVIPFGDHREAARLLLEVLDDAHACRLLAARGAAHARRHFAASRLGERTEALYRRLLAEPCR